MILLVDADSLIFASCYRKRESPDAEKYYTDIAEARNKFDEQYMAIVNHLEEMYSVDKVLTFSGSKGNFRKILNTKYKANRKKQELPPLLHEMHAYVKSQYDSIYGFGIETDDLVARYWAKLTKELGRDEVMIVSIDKDYKQFPCLMYNYHYKHKEILNITEDEALYNFYEQMIVGDTADNVNFFKGKGKRFAERYFDDCATKYQYTKKLYELFIKEYKGKAKLKYIECYNLLKLRTE
jgi:5'-3' exonuclease|tara:strand:- start:1354 stop:2067 length:714 start_codon:yes stop_codon:yes gene_type:complete